MYFITLVKVIYYITQQLSDYLNQIEMKKIFLIIIAAFMLTMCGSSKKVSADGTTTILKPNVQYRDDFKSASNAEKNALLKALKATGKNYSVLVFTKAYKGEKVTVTGGDKKIFSGYLISNLKTGVAEKVRIDNTFDTKVADESNKIEVTIEAEKAKDYKYIYLLKDTTGKGDPFMITYSNTLRPLN